MSGGFNTKFKNDPVAFVKDYAIAPPDDVGMYVGSKRKTMQKSGKSFDFNRTPSLKKVAWANIKKVPKLDRANVTFMPVSEQAITFDLSFEKRGKRHVPMYFLPWSAGGAIIRLTIPRVRDIVQGQLDSPYFFTATITGCSIFIKGTPDHPTIYHAGGETGENDPTAAAQFWLDLMQTHSTHHGAIKAVVDKTDYIRSPDTPNQRTTQAAVLYETWLKNKNRPDLDIQFVEPWGCVFGLRDDQGNWSFYLQENVTVFFYKMSKRFGGGRVKAQNMRSLARPMSIRQIFPSSNPFATLCPPMPRVI